MQPSNTAELGPMLEFAIQQNSPTFLRYPRGASEQTKSWENSQAIELGQAELLVDGEQISIWALGDSSPWQKVSLNRSKKATG